jgi:uncharacterized protein (TIGR02284 family)
MSTVDANTVAKLNDLLNYLHDSHEGYKECASKIHNQKLQGILLKASNNRLEMIHDIENQLNLMNAEASKRGSVAGPAHRLFIDLKALVTGGDEDSIINEIKRGENTLINTYKETLRNPLPADLNQLLKSELMQIQVTIKDIDQASI